jgi:NADH:ubiquinone oxidoreductase subunit 2 (subunit N)
VGLELITWRLLPLLLLKKTRYRVERMMKYFLVQRIASLVWLISTEVGILEDFPTTNTHWVELLGIVALLLKVGVFPFHGWVMELINKREIGTTLFLLTIQKIIPTVIFMKLLSFIKLPFQWNVVVGLGLIFVIFSLFNFTKPIFLFFLSGIYHFSLIFFIMGHVGSNSVILYYFAVYIAYLGFCGWLLVVNQQEIKIHFRRQFTWGGFGILMGMRGLPPFTIFFLKGLFLHTVFFSWGDLFIFSLFGLITLYIFFFVIIFLEGATNTRNPTQPALLSEILTPPTPLMFSGGLARFFRLGLLL